jgi:hypothetical protein
MKRKILFYIVFLYTLIGLIVLFGGSRSSASEWNETFGRIDIGTSISTQRIADYERMIAGSESHILTPNRPLSNIDISILPRVINLKSNKKFIFSRIRLPEKYDPHDIDENSLELSFPSCSLCRVIYPTWQFPCHQHYLTLFLQQDLVSILETLNIDLPAKLNIKISGEINDGTDFEGIETIWIIKEKSKHE